MKETRFLYLDVKVVNILEDMKQLNPRNTFAFVKFFGNIFLFGEKGYFMLNREFSPIWSFHVDFEQLIRYSQHN